MACGPYVPDGFFEETPPDRQDIIKYFSEVGFCPEFGTCSNPVVKKWMSDVRIKIHGNYTDGDRQELERVISELSVLTGLSIKIVNNNQNINIYFVKQASFKKYIPEYKGTVKQDGLFVSINNKNNILYSATICIRDDVDQHLRDHLIREELTQAMGLASDSGSYNNSIFQQDPYYKPTEYAAIDKEVIKLLYNQKMRPGMTKQDVERVFITDSSRIAGN